MASHGWRWWAFHLIIAASCVLPHRAGAQDAANALAAAAASPLLPPGHWAVEAARRAEGLGLAPGYLPVERAVPRAAVGAALRAAAEAARGGAWAEVAAGWVARFQEEFPEESAPLGVRLAVGYGGRAGEAGPGTGIYPDTRTGAAAVPDLSSAEVGAELVLAPHPSFALLAAPSADREGARLERWEAVAAWRALALSVGRQPIGYGYAESGGVTLSARTPLDRVQLGTARPVRLPGRLRALGPVAVSTFFGRVSEARHPGDPYLWGASGFLRPHPRLVLGVHRAALIGGEYAEDPVTLRTVARLLIGSVGNAAFENQIVALEARWRLPTEAWLPMVAHLEWGSEDAAGAWWDVPGRVAGLFIPRLPGLPQVAVGAEHAAFGGSCCGNPPWYRHAVFPGGWTAGDAPLGHGLGGQGSEWLGYAHASLLSGRLRLEARGFRREREEENLFVPGREGASLGGSGSLLWRLRPDAEVRLLVGREAGTDWAAHRWLVSSRVIF